MRRGRVIAAGLLWAALVLIWAIFIHGGNVFMCLGGPDMTEAKCRAANGMPPLTEWVLFMRGWGPVAILCLAGWAAIGTLSWVSTHVHRGPRRRSPDAIGPRLRQRGGL